MFTINSIKCLSFLDEVDSEYEDVVYLSKVKWLSKAATLKSFHLLLPEIKVVVEEIR